MSVDPSGGTDLSASSRLADQESISASERRKRLSLGDLLGSLVFVSILVLLSLRLRKGAGLTDEGYYALFVDDWLKGGIASSSYIVLHQTAALLIYPFAAAYKAVRGSTEGLFLFLRILYLAGDAIAALTWVAFLRKIGLRTAAWAGGVLVLAFVPFGLPAPSYDTTGEQALCVALACLGCACLSSTPARRRAWTIASAIAWAVSTVAYPPLVLPLTTLCGLLFIVRREHGFAFGKYIAAVAAAFGLLWVFAMTALSPSRLLNSATNTGQLNGSSRPGGKLDFSYSLLAGHKTFALLGLAAIAIGVVRPRLSSLLVSCLTAALLSVSLTLPPVFFARSHDVVTLAALTGLGLVVGLRAHADRGSRVIAVIYSVSMVAGLTTAFFAGFPPYNFCLGALPAAVLAVLSPARKAQLWQRLTPAVIAAGAILSTSLFAIYGETPNASAGRQRIRLGPFSGLDVSASDASAIDLAEHTITPTLAGDRSTIFIGRIPGIMVDTPARLRMLSAFPISGTASPTAIATNIAFYRDRARRPSLAFLYRDPYLDPVNPMGTKFLDWYALQSVHRTRYGVLEVYARR